MDLKNIDISKLPSDVRKEFLQAALRLCMRKKR